MGACSWFRMALRHGLVELPCRLFRTRAFQKHLAWLAQGSIEAGFLQGTALLAL